MFGRKKLLHIRSLQSGGLITNYYCTSRCGHCLYGCGPEWKKQYIDGSRAEQAMERSLRLGCHSIHIGGGEPFLNVEGLEAVVEAAKRVGIGVDYVETNSSWFKGDAAAKETMRSLKSKGLSAVLVSISPFHNEHIPFYKVKGVLKACDDAGVRVFPWISDFYHEIDAFDDSTCHGLEAFTERYGKAYLEKLPSRYWIHLGGRAVRTFEKVFVKKEVRRLFRVNRGGCGELEETSHFHMDLFGRYIPGLCAGLSIDCGDLGRPLHEGAYPLITLLYREGIRGLFEMATEQYGFVPADGYISKCHLCLDIRRFLVTDKKVATEEFGPGEFYKYT